MLVAIALGLIAWIALWEGILAMADPVGGVVVGLTARMAYGKTVEVRGPSRVMRFRQVIRRVSGGCK